MMTKTLSLALVGVFLVFGSIQLASATRGCYFPRDVVFVIDSSGSVGQSSYTKNLQFVKAILQNVLQTGPSGMQVGVATFSSSARVEFHLDAYTDVASLTAAVLAINYPSGGTNIAAGINLMTAMFQHAGRPNTLRYGIVFTDGVSNFASTAGSANAARAQNIIMVGVGVGSGVNVAEVNAIGNSPKSDYVFFPTGYSDLTPIEDLLKGITDCDARPYGFVELPVGEICSGTPPCYDHAQCVLDGTNSEITRCRCDYGYIYVEDLICASIITTDIDSSCSTCETNGGVCYDASGDDVKDGCHCPSFTSQADCQKSHATVSCDATTFTMTICYEEQAQYVSAGAVVLVEGKGIEEACKADVATAADSCPVGHHQLVLPLDSAKLAKCGTKSVMTDITRRKYLNTILVQHRLEDMDADDVSFVASCSYDTHANAIFDPVGVVVSTEEKGRHYKPTLSFYVENQLGNAIGEAVSVRLGDKIRFGIDLTADGTYSAIKVVRCLASSKPSLADPTAVTIPLILDSCPSTGQSHITDTNNWQRVSGQNNELRTGFIEMFKMSQGRSVHIHCAVKLCLTGSEADCGSVTCSNPSSHTSYGRRKRSAEEKSIFQVSRQLTWYEPELSSSEEIFKIFDKKSPETFAAIMSIAGVILVVFIIIVVSLIRKTRKQNQKKNTLAAAVSDTSSDIIPSDIISTASLK